ncbi:MAG TPA: APC family permease [Terriglobia bacterium]|nr:APC family permease [Terriglobia bacterium]
MIAAVAKAMFTPASRPPKGTNRGSKVPQVVIATTAMLSFISFWRAAAIVLNDLASSAFYAGGIAEKAIGPAAPWFILGVMLFAYAVCQMYVESCSMFVRGGVYRVVKEAMGGTLAKFSVSALMFDYILTGPISGVSAGLYLVGFFNELLLSAGIHRRLPPEGTAAVFAIAVTIYFWRQNVKGIHDSSEKAARIMNFTTVMVVLMIGWCVYTLWIRGGHLPPWPRPMNLHFSREAEGWLASSHLPELIGLIGVLVAFGHSVLAMSGIETLAQVYREIESPKLPNLKKTAFVVFVYSMLFTSLVSFFAFMIIPSQRTRLSFADNLIAGLAMNVAGPFALRLAFHAFVVVVGVMILAGAVNTAIVGSNGVLNRVSEDGVLAPWFRHPHVHYGTSHRIINLVVALQLLTIILSRGNVILLGEAYAFGVIWSFAMKGLAVLVLRYTQAGPREFRVPLNVKLDGLELPIGLGLITLLLFATAIINLFTKQIATISGVAFTLVFFAIFTVSERIHHRRRGGGHTELDEFHLDTAEDISPRNVGVRPGNVLVPLRDFNTLYNLEDVLKRVNTTKQDVVVLHAHQVGRAGSGEHPLDPEQLFANQEQQMFTNALKVAEKNGKSVKLVLVAANDVWDGVLRSAQALESSDIVLGQSARMPAVEEARLAGLAWERLPAPRPQLTLEVRSPSGGKEYVSYLGPHAPRLTRKEIDLLHSIWLSFSTQVSPLELHHHDIVHFALNEIEKEIAEGKHDEVLERLQRHLHEIETLRGEQ